MNKYTFVDKTGTRPVHGATNAALLGCGTFSDVYRAVATATGKHVAIKCMKNHFDSVDHVNRLREIQALRRLSPHPNIVKLLEVLYDRSTGRLALVFELMEQNAYEMIKGRKRYLADDKILHVSYQIMKGLEHMHKNGIFHRDIKPENILVNGDATKLADFGSCRGIFSKQPFTEYISTRWYRAPECLLTDGYYSAPMDVFGCGCVLFELCALFPLAAGENEVDQLTKLHNVLSTPAPHILAKLKKYGSHMDFDFPARVGTGIAKLLPHASADLIDLINKMLTYDADERITAKQALRHPYFKEIRELDKKLRKQQQAQAPPQRNSISGEPGANGASGGLEDTRTSQQSDDDSNTATTNGTTSGMMTVRSMGAMVAKQPSVEVAPQQSGLPAIPASKAVRQAQQAPMPQGQQQQSGGGGGGAAPALSSGATVSGLSGAGSGSGQAPQGLPKLVPLGKK